MKRYIALLIVTFMFCMLSFCGCAQTIKTENESVDYSDYSFTDIFWTRDTEYDTETIYFGADGTFGYSCACGNPVNDADLCEGYTYDDETKIITINCEEITENMVTTIKILKCDENTIHLDFD